MQAIQFTMSVPRYAVGLGLRRVAPSLLWRGMVDLAPLVTHRFTLDAYDQALKMHLARGKHGLVKGVFAFTGL